SKVLFSSYPAEGRRRATWFDQSGPRGTLECYDLEAQKQERLADRLSDFTLGRDARTLLYRSGGSLRVLKARQKAPEPRRADGERPGREGGGVDLERVKVSVAPAAEGREMCEEAWGLQRAV